MHGQIMLIDGNFRKVVQYASRFLSFPNYYQCNEWHGRSGIQYSQDGMEDGKSLQRRNIR